MPDGGILTGPEIVREVGAGNIVIDPWDPARVRPDGEDALDRKRLRRVNSASYDLTLGPKVAVYRAVTYFTYGGEAYYPKPDGTARASFGEPFDFKRRDVSHWLRVNPAGVLDARKKNEVFEFTIDPREGWLLRPGVGYLMHTNERILTDKFVPVIDGKSSMGRLFVTAHVTAGYGDAGFNGQYTLEVVALYPTFVYPGMRFCQMRFTTQVGESLSYQNNGGHYIGEASMGPVPSMSWKQFEEEQ